MSTVSKFVSRQRQRQLTTFALCVLSRCLAGMTILRALQQKVALLWPHLDERARRLFAANEARHLGHGGVAAVSRACGLSRVTITKGGPRALGIPAAGGPRAMDEQEYAGPRGRPDRAAPSGQP